MGLAIIQRQTMLHSLGMQGLSVFFALPLQPLEIRQHGELHGKISNLTEHSSEDFYLS